MSAVQFRVGAHRAGLKTAFTIAVFNLIAENYGGSIGMKTAFPFVGVHRFVSLSKKNGPSA
jgi:hypothetical protein